jgi:hypothetical protein
MEYELRGDKAMNFRVWKWLSVVLVVFLLTLSLTVFAQEAPKDEQAVASQQSQVPQDISKKAREYKGSPSPPRNLVKQPDGHWTPYSPPAPAEGDYIILAGDTLSVLSQQKLGNWLLWPTIWDMNPYITDAHWIYPGDPLVMPAAPKVIGEEMETEEEEEVTGQNGERFILDNEAALPPVNAKDIYCSGFISDRFRMPSLKIASGANRMRESLGEGDIIYLNGGSQNGVQNGAEYFIIGEGPPVYHSVSGKAMGKLFDKVGKAKVICVQEKTAIAKITLSCDEVRYGMGLLPYSPIPMPFDVKTSENLPLCEMSNGKITGKVIWTEDRLESMGQHSIIYTDLGANQKLLPGDKFWIYRYSAVEDTLVSSISDLFKQQQIHVAGKDLFRADITKQSKIKNPNKELKKNKKDSRLPEGAALGEGEDPLNELTPEKTDSRMPSNVDRVYTEPNEGIAGIRNYVGEAVVLTTQGETSCMKVIISSAEIKLGDSLQLE